VNAEASCAAGRLVPRALGMAAIAVAVAAVVFGVARELGRDSEAVSRAPVAVSDDAYLAAPTVYYFHTDTRCWTCNTIEEQTTAVVRAAFAEEILAGRLQYRVVNLDTARHFREDFQLAFGSVVVASADGVRWENLSEVWKLVHGERARFNTYLIEHIGAFIEAER
jgi:hypothetical protein